jgi:ubiquinone/menaquinone biosynthesis C-methylase UbiE
MNNFYDRYWFQKSGHLSDFEIKWPKLKKFIPLNKSVIVDFGCGKGEILKEMALLNPSARYIGVDISEKALGQAKQNFPQGEFYKENEENIPLGDNSVDFVFSSEVIEHIYDTEKTIIEIARILKSGGQLLLTVPYHGFLKNILIALFAFNRHFNPVGSHIRFFSKKSLFSLLKKSGFNILKYGYWGRFYPISHSIYVLAEKK